MIGKDYLKLRARLGTALFSLQTLAGELHVAADSVAALQELQQSLREPFLFVVIGDAQAGKSTLLNAIFGRDFCRAQTRSATGEVHLFKYGNPECDVAVDDFLIECQRNAGFLRDFNLIDTPGVNLLMAGRKEMTAQFLQRADLILLVLSAVNPWSATAWSFLQLIDRRSLDRAAIILQQSELRSADELASIVQYLQKTLHERVGHDCPVFPVSAQRALAAKVSGENVSEVLATTGMSRLERFINSEIVGGKARLENLRRVCHQTQKIITEISARARGTTTAEQEAARIQEIDHELADSKEQALRQIGGVLWSMAQSYEKAQKRSEELLLERLTLPNSFRLLFQRGDQWRNFHAQTEELLRGAIQLQIENAVQLLDADLREVWTRLADSLRTSFAAGPVQVSLPEFRPQQAELLRGIELTLVDCARHQQINDQVETRLARAARWLQLPLVLALIGALAVLAVAILRPAQFQITAAVAGGATLAGIILALLKRRRLLADLRQQMFRNREAILSGIEDHLRRSVERFFAGLAPALEPLHNVFTPPPEFSTPLRQRLEQLNEVFAMNAAELDLSSCDNRSPAGQ